VAEIGCTACQGVGCVGCGGRGFIELTECPKASLDGELLEMLEYSDLYQKGLPPVTGGTLDQARWFNEFAMTVWQDQSHLKAKLGVID
jgi:hypothetical protein